MTPVPILVAALVCAALGLLLATLCIRAKEIVWPALLLLSALMFAASAAGIWTVDMMKRGAVDIGHAEYYIDPETNEREWRWLPRCAEETKNDDS